MPKTIAIDFDGVIHQYSNGWQDGEIYDLPVTNAFHTIVKLQLKGYKIVIFTARPEEQHEKISKWLALWSIKANIYLNDITITNIKPRAVAYIDDRAIRFTSWKDILNYF